MHILVLSEKTIKNAFYPISLTRHVADVKCGILSFRQKWLTMAQEQGYYLVVADDTIERSSAEVVLPANCIPPTDLSLADFFLNPESYIQQFKTPTNLWEVIAMNKEEISADIDRLGLKHVKIQHFPQVRLTGTEQVYIQEGAKLENCILNTTDGPICIDEDALIMDGAMLRGPIYIGKNSVVKMGATIYQGTSIGDASVVGGEIKNSIIHSNSNKSHHGYIGDSYIGEWCNLGAGTTGSNLKNTAGNIRAWNHGTESMIAVGSKAGVTMGDHVKTAINISFNGGTVIGPYCNIFGATTPIPKFVPEFSWGIDSTVKYDLDKLTQDMKRWMEMKDQALTDEMIKKTKSLYTK